MNQDIDQYETNILNKSQIGAYKKNLSLFKSLKSALKEFVIVFKFDVILKFPLNQKHFPFDFWKDM